MLIGDPSSGSSVLGIWESAEEPPEFEASFDLETSPASKPVVFVNNMPADLDRAAAEIDRAEANLQISQTAFDEAQVRLTSLLRSQSGGVSFSMEAGSPDPGSPESELLALIRYSLGDEELAFTSFAAGDEKSGQWAKVSAQFQEYLQVLGQIVGHYAWIETHESGALQARTSVGWTGDFDTAWQITPTPDLVALHRRTIGLTLASRNAMLRTFSEVAGAAIKLAALATNPASAILALPVAWNFIRKIQTESARYQSIKQEIVHGQ